MEPIVKAVALVLTFFLVREVCTKLGYKSEFKTLRIS